MRLSHYNMYILSLRYEWGNRDWGWVGLSITEMRAFSLYSSVSHCLNSSCRESWARKIPFLRRLIRSVCSNYVCVIRKIWMCYIAVDIHTYIQWQSRHFSISQIFGCRCACFTFEQNGCVYIQFRSMYLLFLFASLALPRSARLFVYDERLAASARTHTQHAHTSKSSMPSSTSI